jgi:hypothetical protein
MVNPDSLNSGADILPGEAGYLKLNYVYIIIKSSNW